VDGDALVAQGEEIILYVAGATSWDGTEPETECRNRLQSAQALEYDALLEEHIADHKERFGRVSFHLDGPWKSDVPTDKRLQAVKNGEDDPALMALYFQYGRYLLLGSSRPGCRLPANLQGIWNEYTNAPWGSDFHTNINVQMNYWPAEVTNLADCHAPLFDLTEVWWSRGAQRLCA
jgi:alpha-L-fucosidase 2